MTQLVTDVSGIAFSDFDPFGMAFRADPASFHKGLIEQSPVFVRMEGVPSACISDYAQVQHVLRNARLFSSVKPKGLPGMDRIDFFNGLPVMNYSDAPDHARRRRIVNPAFTPARTAALCDGAAETIEALIDSILARGGPFEAISELTKPMAIDVLMRRFLGIEDKDQPIFLGYVGTLPLLDKMQPGDPKPQPYLDAWARGQEFCRQQQELARRGECRNLIGVIAEGAEGGAIDEAEMMAMMIVLLIGGVSTVAAAAAAALNNLAGNPGLLARIRAEPALAGAVLEEAMRLDPPVSVVMRFATQDTEVGGRIIPQGMPVYALIATACHDPKVYPDPYRFDIDRPNGKDHLAFGYGPHTCIGNTITRAIVPRLIVRIAERMPGLALADRPDAIEWDYATPRARHIGVLHLQP